MTNKLRFVEETRRSDALRALGAEIEVDDSEMSEIEMSLFILYCQPYQR